MAKIRKEYSTAFDIDVQTSKYHQGTYVDFCVAIQLCQRYGLAELQAQLKALKISFTELVQIRMPRSDDSIPQVITEVTSFDSNHVQIIVEGQTILLRRGDCFLNATQIIKLAKKDKNERKRILDQMKKDTKVDVKKGDGRKAICGSWVNLQHGRILCNSLCLQRQLQPLLEYAQRLQGDNVERTILRNRNSLARTGTHPLFIAGRVPPNPAGLESQIHQARLEEQQVLPRTVPERTNFEVHPSNAVGQIRESMRPDSALPREWRDIQRTESMRPDSALPREWRDIQRTESRVHFDSSDPDNDIQVLNPISDAASESSISSSQPLIEWESEPSSVHFGAKAAPLHHHTQCSLEETESHSPLIKNSHYSVWESQSQHSHLSVFKPNLMLPSGTASPYESFTNIC